MHFRIFLTCSNFGTAASCRYASNYSTSITAATALLAKSTSPILKNTTAQEERTSPLTEFFEAGALPKVGYRRNACSAYRTMTVYFGKQKQRRFTSPPHVKPRKRDAPFSGANRFKQSVTQTLCRLNNRINLHLGCFRTSTGPQPCGHQLSNNTEA